eukprot:6476150-Amphidinium_carterae.1
MSLGSIPALSSSDQTTSTTCCAGEASLKQIPFIFEIVGNTHWHQNNSAILIAVIIQENNITPGYQKDDVM